MNTLARVCGYLVTAYLLVHVVACADRVDTAVIRMHAYGSGTFWPKPEIQPTGTLTDALTLLVAIAVAALVVRARRPVRVALLAVGYGLLIAAPIIARIAEAQRLDAHTVGAAVRPSWLLATGDAIAVLAGALLLWTVVDLGRRSKRDQSEIAPQPLLG